MYTQLSNKFTHLTWDYLEISDTFINSRYDWVTISCPIENREFPWAHEYDMIRLFLLCCTFRSESEALSWIKRNLNTQMSPYHLELIGTFCYPERYIVESIDELIENADHFHLLRFIYAVLDRSLLWFQPESCWPGDFRCILWKISSQLPPKRTMTLKMVEQPEVEGMYIVSHQHYTHVFYKFQNLVTGIEKGELYYNLKDLAKQAHEALIQSMLFLFSKKGTSLDEISWERKMSEIITHETNWCKEQLLKIIHSTDEYIR